MNTKTISVTGAAGRLAYAFIFELASGAVFGSDTLIHLKLVDLPGKTDILTGIKMEIEDCSFRNIASVTFHEQEPDAYRDADWCVLIGAKPRGPGMERSDLLAQNASIFKDQGQLINSVCNSDTKIIVVGNPCNTNALIVNKYTPNIPSKNIFALMTLDENRAKALLAEHLNVKAHEISNLIIYGNHSSTMYPDAFNAKVNGLKIQDLDKEWVFNMFVPKVQNRGAEIISKLGMSSAASAGKSVCDFIRTIESRSKQLFSAACISDGEYGSAVGTFFSAPYMYYNDELTAHPSIHHSPDAQRLIENSINEIAEEAKAVEHL